MAEAKILVARHEGVVQIRVVGRATFKISQGLREYAVPLLRSGEVKSLVIELSECRGMDSTFMGVLAMVGLEGRDGVSLVIVNANDHQKRLLTSIGVARLFHFASEPVPKADWQSLCEVAADPLNMKGVAGTVLSAHRTLMDLDPENIPRFRDVVDILTEEIEKSEDESNEGEQ